MNYLCRLVFGMSLLIPVAVAAASPLAFAAEAPLDPSLRPADSGDEISPVFRDMGVVQRKYMDKAHKLLLSNYFSMDFSDGPYTMYGFNFDPGYAISDFLEVYANIAPFFISNRRSIVDLVQQLKLANGDQATLTAATANRQYGGEVIWAPLYGKDSIGTRTIIHSDTFVKFGVMNILYDQGSGMRYQLGIGKTFFTSARTGLRVTFSGNYVQTIVNDVKSFKTVLMADFGYVLYMF